MKDAYTQECPGRRGERDVLLGTFPVRTRWVSSIYRWSGNNVPLSEREKNARKPGPVTIIKG